MIFPDWLFKFSRRSRGERAWEWVHDLSQDVRYALRLLRKSPFFSFSVILILTVGIGANTAIFSVVNAVLLQPLPYNHAQQLVNIFEANLGQGIKASGCSYQDFKELQRSGIFSAAAGTQRHDLTLTGFGDPAVVTTVVVTPEVFPLLGIAPLAGRYFLPQDNERGSAPVVLLSEGLWRTRFNASSSVVGQSIHLDQQAFTIVGIMPAAFHVPVFGSHQEIWIPLVDDPLFGGWMERPGVHFLRVMGRLNPGASVASQQSKLDALTRSLNAEFPVEDGGWSLHVASLHEAIVGDIRAPLLVLLAAVGFVLLLACVNIANLLLARATSRAREIALRQALGAARSRIVRQLLTESVVLALFGALLGVALAYASTGALTVLLPADIPSTRPVHVDGWSLGFALLIAIVASVVFGLTPALLTSTSDMQSNLKTGVPGSGIDSHRLRLRSLLTCSEIALALVLVVAAGLLARSLSRMTLVDPGFSAERLLKAEISLPRFEYSTPQSWSAFSRKLLDSLQTQPGMEQSAIAVPLPLADPAVALPFSIPGHATSGAAPPSADYVSVSSRYFPVMGIPLLQGRLFNEEDLMSAPKVAIISQSFARLQFPGGQPIGKTLVFGFPPDTNVVRQIVGVVGDVRDTSLAQPPGPMMYVPFSQAPFWGGGLVIKTSVSSSAAANEIRATVQSLDRGLPVTDLAEMPAVLSQSVAGPRFRTWLLSLFGAIALLLAAAGVCGMAAYSVGSRTREFGIRAALGATPASIGQMVIREALGLTCAGLGAGLILALALAHYLRAQLYGIGSYDPGTFAAAAAILLLVSLCASYFPALRATRVDPVIALRQE